MRCAITLVSVFYALLSGTSSSENDIMNDKRWLVSLLDLVELDYEDHCDQRATATWNELIGSSGGLSVKLERDKVYGLFSSSQANDVQSYLKAHNVLGDSEEIVKRKVNLILQPGDTLLNTEDWLKLVTFGDNALNKLRSANNYYCAANNHNCTLQELHNSLAKQPDEETVRLMKESYEKNLPSLDEYLDDILPLLKNASKQNNYKTVEQYWDSLAEYEGAILKARELWESVKPLYTKLHKYVAKKLKGSDAVGKPLSVNSLRSLNGDDWTNIIEKVLPPHPDIYVKVNENLKAKGVRGSAAFKDAADLIRHIQLGDLESHIFSESLFNGTCPPILVDWCKPNKIKIVSCNDISLANYLDTYEAALRIKHKELAALHSNNSYFIREAGRFSAVYEAIPGFASLLALNPYSLDKMGLYPYTRFMYNTNHHRLVLQMYMALRDLPKLSYYLALDEWRLMVLMDSTPVSKMMGNWGEYRRNVSMLETTNEDFLGDPYVVFNKPYIGKFMGLILKYQIYQSFAEELMSDESDLTQHVAENSHRLTDTMMQGFGVIWPDLVSDLLAKRENGLEYTALTDYYRLLDEYLDSQLDPTIENTIDEYVMPEPEVPVEANENEIPVDDGVQEEKQNIAETERPNDHDNTIFDEDKYSKYETSTVGVLEIKNPVPTKTNKGEKPIEEASYSTYWWIGIAVAIAIICILIGIIVKKRHNHRKQLEKQRRENSHA